MGTWQKLLTKKDLAALPPLYSQENNREPVAQVKFFTAGRWTWYATEYDPESGTFFGYVVSGLGSDCDEWGNFTLGEFEEHNKRSGTIASLLKGIFPIERDQYFTPTPVSEVVKRHALAPVPTG